ncbi:MAG: mandelate racemase/muconate lactonizing enzyme family protein [Chloroflexi bacterium]|nr:mandelate racemase/muconate lactonizing enzyme family protein [Chloroflexota bacterium]
MKITKIEALVAGLESRNQVFIRTNTDEGIHGSGEAYNVGPDMATVSWVEYFADQFVGHDPTRIEFLWALGYQGARFPMGSSGMAALSGIEHSLWDISGKALGVPVYKLLGGRVRDRVRVYHGVHADSPGALADHALERRDWGGFTAFKTSPLANDWRGKLWNEAIKDGRALLSGLRNAVGADAEIGLDAHAAVWELPRALDLADSLAEYDPMFMEEALRMENRHAMSELRRKMPFPTATGECLYTKFEFEELIRSEAADILQPDVCICGGLMEMRKIAANAEAHDVVVAPHNPLGPLATVINVHFSAATSNFLILEYREPSPIEKSLVTEWLRPGDGHVEIPDRPGWGIDLVEDAIRKHPYQRPWHRGDRSYPDGSVGYI